MLKKIVTQQTILHVYKELPMGNKEAETLLHLLSKDVWAKLKLKLNI